MKGICTSRWPWAADRNRPDGVEPEAPRFFFLFSPYPSLFYIYYIMYIRPPTVCLSFSNRRGERGVRAPSEKYFRVGHFSFHNFSPIQRIGRRVAGGNFWQEVNRPSIEITGGGERNVHKRRLRLRRIESPRTSVPGFYLSGQGKHRPCRSRARVD